jgi:hypothetical protein
MFYLLYNCESCAFRSDKPRFVTPPYHQVTGLARYQIKIQATTKYRQNLPNIIIKNAENNGNFNQPPAKHSASPTIGSQEKNNAHSPRVLTTASAFCLSADKSVATGNFLAANMPNPQVVMAPKVLPTVAANSRFSIR